MTLSPTPLLTPGLYTYPIGRTSPNVNIKYIITLVHDLAALENLDHVLKETNIDIKTFQPISSPRLQTFSNDIAHTLFTVSRNILFIPLPARPLADQPLQSLLPLPCPLLPPHCPYLAYVPPHSLADVLRQCKKMQMFSLSVRK